MGRFCHRAALLCLCFLFSLTAAAVDAAVDRPSPPAEPNRYSLVRCVEQALASNPAVGASRFALESAKAETGVARGRMLPSLTLSAGRSYLRSVSDDGDVDDDYLSQHTDTASLRATQTLFAGLSIFKGYQRAKLNEKFKIAEKEATEARLILDVQTLFFDLLKARGDVQTLEDSVERLRKSVSSVRAFADVKMVPYVDVLQAQADLADTEQRLSQARIAVENFKVELNTLLGLPSRAPVVYVGDLDHLTLDLPWSLQQCLDHALQHRADLDVPRLATQMAEKEAEAILGRYWPQVELQAGVNHQDRDYQEAGSDLFGNEVDRDYQTNYWSAGINLQWNLFDGTRTYHEEKRIENEIGRLREGVRETRDKIEAQVITSYQTLQEARQRIESTSMGLDTALESHRRAKVRFEARVGTIIELLDAQARLTRAETSHSQARADYQKALATLLYAMGERNPGLLYFPREAEEEKQQLAAAQD